MPITNIDWERVADRLEWGRDRAREADMDAAAEAEIQAANENEAGVRINGEVLFAPDIGWTTEEECDMASPKPPSLRDIVEKLIDLWTWMVYVKHHDWARWQGWERPAPDYFPLCGYTERVVNKLEGGISLGHSICPYCPYVICFGHRCEDNTEPYYKWTRARDRDIIEKHANEYLQKLLELRKQLILNPDKFKVKKR